MVIDGLGPQTTQIFSYGSNSTAQLRARVANPRLITRPAILEGFVRVFCYESDGWGGGAVASLCPSLNRNDVTHGAVVSLTFSELKMLDRYEGGYRKVEVEVVVLEGLAPLTTATTTVTERREKAVAYIAGCEPSSPTDPFTAPMTVPPSEQYLTSIHGMLREHWAMGVDRGDRGIDATIAIRGYRADLGIAVSVSEWHHPGFPNLGLEALCVEVKETPGAPTQSKHDT
jgi:cation transport regulator ChaC